MTRNQKQTPRSVKVTCPNCGSGNIYTGQASELRCVQGYCRTILSEQIAEALRKRMDAQLNRMKPEAEWADRGDHVAQRKCEAMILTHDATAEALRCVREWTLYDCIPAA